jgi:hypothetical protein
MQGSDILHMKVIFFFFTTVLALGCGNSSLNNKKNKETHYPFNSGSRTTIVGNENTSNDVEVIENSDFRRNLVANSDKILIFDFWLGMTRQEVDYNKKRQKGYKKITQNGGNFTIDGNSFSLPMNFEFKDEKLNSISMSEEKQELEPLVKTIKKKYPIFSKEITESEKFTWNTYFNKTGTKFSMVYIAEGGKNIYKKSNKILIEDSYVLGHTLCYEEGAILPIYDTDARYHDDRCASKNIYFFRKIRYFGKDELIRQRRDTELKQNHKKNDTHRKNQETFNDI